MTNSYHSLLLPKLLLPGPIAPYVYSSVTAPSYESRAAQKNGVHAHHRSLALVCHIILSRIVAFPVALFDGRALIDLILHVVVIVPALSQQV